MSKLKLAAATGLAATALGAGALVGAPSASAMAPRCAALAAKSIGAYKTGEFMNSIGQYQLASYYFGQARAYGDLAIDCYRGMP